MKKFFTIIAIVSAMMLPASAAFAAPGGMPAAHGVDGATFGGAVSGLAQTNPGALAEHVSHARSDRGIPGAHGLTGRQFGGAVSDLAQTSPGALAAHVSGR